MITSKDFELLINTNFDSGNNDRRASLSELKNIFNGQPNGHATNAIIGWNDQDFSYGYVEGFFSIAHLMYEQIFYQPDILVYPIIFNYRHYVELSLKSLTLKAQLFFGEAIGYKANHDIKGVLKVFTEVVDNNQHSFFLPDEVRDAILKIYRFDPDNIRFRYITDKHGELTNEFNHEFINLSSLHYCMNTLHNYFDGIRLCFDDDNIYGDFKVSHTFIPLVMKILTLKEGKNIKNSISMLNRLKEINYTHNLSGNDNIIMGLEFTNFSIPSDGYIRIPILVRENSKLVLEYELSIIYDGNLQKITEIRVLDVP